VGVGFAVTDGYAGFPVSYLSGELSDIEMKIDEKGLLWISPRNKDQKYISSQTMYDDEGYINTGDIVEKRGDRVYFLGRDSGAINVGGNKVQPEEVESVLLSSGIIKAAYVYAMKNPMMGSLVCADVIPEDIHADKSKMKKELLLFCRKRLDAFKVPAIIKFVTELETTQSGKLKRK
jgi:acyl-coenzyme A synthetase/AMP-(fatty) acid ligase